MGALCMKGRGTYYLTVQVGAAVRPQHANGKHAAASLRVLGCARSDSPISGPTLAIDVAECALLHQLFSETASTLLLSSACWFHCPRCS